MKRKMNKLVLIPKVKNPSKITEYRPISLCNVIYKLAAKTVANRLKTILSSIVSENQSAFTKGRFITDNILIVYKTMHHINQKRARKIGEMALKLDMSKAYDRVKWVCLKGIMEKLDIHWRMVEVVMRCVCTITYSVRTNGQPKGRIFLLGVYIKGTLFLLIYFYFVQRAYLVYLKNRWKEAVSKEWLFVVVLLVFLTYFCR